jgi:Ni,Fe-hydrogenase III large subunit
MQKKSFMFIVMTVMMIMAVGSLMATDYYVRTDGTNRPIRHKVRAPSYVNIPTFQASCKGIPIADALITLAAAPSSGTKANIGLLVYIYSNILPV